MPRQPRILLPLSYYHIMARGNNKHCIFNSADDYQYYLQLITHYKQDNPFNLFHYCLIPNHIHLQIQTQSSIGFSTFMKRISLAYFHYFSKRYGWVGHFWQGRYKSQPIGKDSYFTQVGKYIELNPVRAGLVDDPNDYRWSSYRHYSVGAKDDLITDDMFYPALGTSNLARQTVYKKLVIDDIVIQSSTKKIWGSPTQRYREQQKVDRKLTKKQNK